MNKQYDYLIVGAGLFGAVFAREMTDAGKSCLVIDRRAHAGGNIYCKNINGIDVHAYGAHIFHTSDERVWDYVNRFVHFNHYVNSPVAIWKDELYNLPFNMNTFSKLWGVKTPAEAKAVIDAQVAKEQIDEPKNLEEQALKLVGRDIYEKLIKGYTEKQWGRPCTELPAFIIRRLPLRFTFDNNYFKDPHQGIPVEGYNALIDRLLEGSTVLLETDYRTFIEGHAGIAAKTLYTGPIDEYYDFVFGHLAYRSLRFEESICEEDNVQGCAVVNYTEAEVPYTRIIEHKHFVFGTQKGSVITKEYSAEWTPGAEPYYPVNNDENNALYEKYKARAAEDENILFGGRLGTYRYLDMDKIIAEALDLAEAEMKH